MTPDSVQEVVTMSMLSRGVLFAALLAAVSGCGDDGGGSKSGCQKACEEDLKESLAKNYGVFVSCTESNWADARDCAACIVMLKEKYDIQVIQKECFCPEHFGGTVPASCKPDTGP